MTRRTLSPVHKAYRQIMISFEEPCAEHGLLAPEGHVLSYLSVYGPCPVSEIHRILGVKRSTLSSLLDRLESKRLLRRTPNPDDRRSLLLEIEDEGREIAAQLQVVGDALDEAIRERVTEDDLRGFERVLAAIGESTRVDVRPSASTISSPEPNPTRPAPALRTTKVIRRREK